MALTNQMAWHGSSNNKFRMEVVENSWHGSSNLIISRTGEQELA
jgi:hypothetical protein